MEAIDWLAQWGALRVNDPDLRLDASQELGVGNQYCRRITLTWQGASAVTNHLEAQLHLQPGVTCQWQPHLTPEANDVIGQAFFDSPALIFQRGPRQLALIPDLTFMAAHPHHPVYLDQNAPAATATVGLGATAKHRHVYAQRSERPIPVGPGEALLAFYLLEVTGQPRDFRAVTRWLWEQFGPTPAQEPVAARLASLTPYVEHAYSWAFEQWRDPVWHEFDYAGQPVGGTVFLARAAQKPGRGEEENWREPPAIWFQSWFSALRSAYGYALWGQAHDRPDLVARATRVKNLVLTAPQTTGLFPSIFVPGPGGNWSAGHWEDCDRRPNEPALTAHLADMSWTCHWLMQWYRDVEPAPAIQQFVDRYLRRLLTFQQPTGAFPAWVDAAGQVSPHLKAGAEGGLHAWVLAEAAALWGNTAYLTAARAALTFLRQEILPTGRWEDFETYWSCSPQWAGKQEGQRVARNGQFNQCNLSVYWASEAFAAVYAQTHDPADLAAGETCLAQLSLYQAIWQPPYLREPVVGGFSVMTSDDEWLDARQSLFAETYLAYYRLTGDPQYRERGLWAMRAAFAMMYCPENPVVKQMYEERFPFLDERDFGFEMENAEHAENVDRVGEFAGFDWGAGSAATTLIRLQRLAGVC